jgi:hypothetical protein
MLRLLCADGAIVHHPQKNGNGADAQFRGGAGDKLKSRSYST